MALTLIICNKGSEKPFRPFVAKNHAVFKVEMWYKANREFHTLYLDMVVHAEDEAEFLGDSVRRMIQEHLETNKQLWEALIGAEAYQMTHYEIRHISH